MSYLVNALVEHDRAHLAEQWLSAALTSATPNAGRYVPGAQTTWHDPHHIADTLAIVRRQVGDSLGLALDAADLRAARILAILDWKADLRFWPEPGCTGPSPPRRS